MGVPREHGALAHSEAGEASQMQIPRQRRDTNGQIARGDVAKDLVGCAWQHVSIFLVDGNPPPGARDGPAEERNVFGC